MNSCPTARLPKHRALFAAILLFCMFLLIFALPAAAAGQFLAEEVVLSRAERAYVAEKGVFRAAFVDKIAPLQYKDSRGNTKGISVMVLNEMALMSRFKVEYEAYDSVEEALDSGADIFLSMSERYSGEDLALTKPYLQSDTILFYHVSVDPNKLSGKKQVVIKGGALPAGIPESDLIFCHNREESFKAVETGRADYGYANAFSVAYYALQGGYKNIATIPQAKVDRSYSFAVAADNEILLSVLNKSINSINDTRLQILILEGASQVERNITFSTIVENYFAEIFAVTVLVVAALTISIGYSVHANRRLKEELSLTIEKEEEIRYLSFHDKLTGLYNRAYFEEELKKSDNKRQLPISVIMGDINGLKMTNDIFGHEAGDNLLKSAARALKNSCRPEDVIARYGGDEFAIILPGVSYKKALKICERISNTCHNTCNKIIPTSISLGCAAKETKNKILGEVLKQAEAVMYEQKMLEGRSVRSSIISALEVSLHEKDIETREHVTRMVDTATKAGKALGLSPDKISDLNLLARLHDIGKITIDDKILNKNGRLTAEEFEMVKKHSEAGYRIALSSLVLSNIAEDILHHHERWDGAGYPEGLKGEEIPLLSRIVSIADAYDAMTNDRPYRKAMDKTEALAELRRERGQQFDPALVPIFISVIENEGT